MGKIKIIYLTLAFLALSTVPLPAHSKQDDFQLWNLLAINYGIPNSKFTFIWVAQNRLKNNASDFLLFFTDVGFTYKVWDWFSLGMYYRFQKVDGRSIQQVPYPEFNFFTSLGPVDFLSKNRYQTFISSTDTQFQYRNLISFSHDFTLDSITLTPFFYDEIFLGTHGSPVSQNRVAAGNGFGFFQGKLIFKLYYIFQIVQSPPLVGFQRRHVLATDIVLNF